MRLQDRPALPFSLKTLKVSATPRSLLAAILSFACVFSLGVDVTAIPAAAKDKKPKQDPALKGLPITELRSTASPTVRGRGTWSAFGKWDWQSGSMGN